MFIEAWKLRRKRYRCKLVEGPFSAAITVSIETHPIHTIYITITG